MMALVKKAAMYSAVDQFEPRFGRAVPILLLLLIAPALLIFIVLTSVSGQMHYGEGVAG